MENNEPHNEVTQGEANPPRQSVKHEVAQEIIEAMKQGDTPWQKPWIASAMKPRNGATDNEYRGVNRILLSLAGQGMAGQAWSDPRFVTFHQAAANGWKVKKGEKGQMIVKVVDLQDPQKSGRADLQSTSKGEGGDNSKGSDADRDQENGRADSSKRFVLKRYFVFNAQQVAGMPPLPVVTAQPEFAPIDNAEAVINALKEKTGLLVVHGGNTACYIPATDEVRLPHKQSFKSVYGYYSTALHEASHSTLSERRLNRTEALGKKWGDAAYAHEELRAEISSAILAAETGVPIGQDADHIGQHASYVNSWIKAIQDDPMVIFSAAKDADQMASYLLTLAREHVVMKKHKEWVAEYDGALAPGLQH
jgi:antirestriction protein ArdC